MIRGTTDWDIESAIELGACRMKCWWWCIIAWPKYAVMVRVVKEAMLKCDAAACPYVRPLDPDSKLS